MPARRARRSYSRERRAEGTAGGGGREGRTANGNVRGPVVGGNEPMWRGARRQRRPDEQEYRTRCRHAFAIETHGVVRLARRRGDPVREHAGDHRCRTRLRRCSSCRREGARDLRVHRGGFGASSALATTGDRLAPLAQGEAPVRSSSIAAPSTGGRNGELHQRLRSALGRRHAAGDRAEGYGSAGCAAGAGCAGPGQDSIRRRRAHGGERRLPAHGTAAAFRAPGHPQGAFALEQAIDELAEGCGWIARAARSQRRPSARREERRVGGAVRWIELRKLRDKGPAPRRRLPQGSGTTSTAASERRGADPRRRQHRVPQRRRRHRGWDPDCFARSGRGGARPPAQDVIVPSETPGCRKGAFGAA